MKKRLGPLAIAVGLILPLRAARATILFSKTLVDTSSFSSSEFLEYLHVRLSMLDAKP